MPLSWTLPTVVTYTPLPDAHSVNTMLFNDSSHWRVTYDMK